MNEVQRQLHAIFNVIMCHTLHTFVDLLLRRRLLLFNILLKVDMSRWRHDYNIDVYLVALQCNPQQTLELLNLL